jgi:Clp amino terminal domain, pathogenicity island component
MFSLYSERARQVIFLARLVSGARGAELIDLDDLIAALIVEDQNQISDALGMLGITGQFVPATSHHPFLPPNAASSLLENIKRCAPLSPAIPTSADMGLSPALKETLAAASDLKKRLRSKKLTPLRLLAALLAGSHNRVQALQEAGVTEEKIVEAIRREDRL